MTDYKAKFTLHQNESITANFSLNEKQPISASFKVHNDPPTVIGTDYEQMENKPSINGVELVGNKTTEDLGIDIDTSHLATKQEVEEGLDTKQDKLTAGDGISIENNVISNTRTNAEWGNITGDLSNQTDLQNVLDSKQDNLTAGSNIRIEDNVISSTAQESFFRGRFIKWENVPTDSSLYQANYRGERTPSYNDYIVVEDASTYVSDFDKTMTIVHDESTYKTIQVTENGVTTTYDLFIDANTPSEIIIGSGSVSVRADSAWFNGNINYTALRPVKVGNRYYEAGDKILSYNYYVTNTIDINYSTESNAYQGSWRFFYNGVWNTNGIEGWKPEYQIEEVMPVATETQAGIAKLYTTSGSNTDGSMTQQAVGSAISTHNTATNAHSNIRGVANGLATLDNNAKVPMSQINDALIGNVSYQGLWNAETNTPFLADPTGGLPTGYKVLGYIDFKSDTYIDTGVFIDETDETIEYDIKMTPERTSCFPFGAAGSSAGDNNTGSLFFNSGTIEYFAGDTRGIRLGEVVTGKDYLINIKLDQTTKTVTIIENDLRVSQSYTGSIIAPVPIILGGLYYGTANNPIRNFNYVGKIYYFIIKKNGETVKQYQPAQRISDGAYGFYEQVSGEFVVSSNASFASGGGEIEIPKGYYYITTVAGEKFGYHYDVGDWIISAGGYWSKVDNTDAVVSVNGRTGNVVLTANDIDTYNRTEIDDKFTVANEQIDANTEAIAKNSDDIKTLTQVIIRRWE